MQGRWCSLCNHTYTAWSPLHIVQQVREQLLPVSPPPAGQHCVFLSCLRLRESIKNWWALSEQSPALPLRQGGQRTLLGASSLEEDSSWKNHQIDQWRSIILDNPLYGAGRLWRRCCRLGVSIWRAVGRAIGGWGTVGLSCCLCLLSCFSSPLLLTLLNFHCRLGQLKYLEAEETYVFRFVRNKNFNHWKSSINQNIIMSDLSNHIFSESSWFPQTTDALRWQKQWQIHTICKHGEVHKIKSALKTHHVLL